MVAACKHAWHDGRLQTLSEVHISPLDRGFLFGDGVYEVIPVYSGRALGLDEHLQRMRESLDAIALTEPCDDLELRRILDEVIRANGSAHQSLYLQISRSGDDGRDHKFPEANVPSLFVMSSPLSPPSKAKYRGGFSAITLPDDRWQRCDIKSTSMLANVLAREAATRAGALEAVLERDGFLVEGAASAIGCAHDGELNLPPETRAMLPSVTRRLTIEVAQALGIKVNIEPISMQRVREADELLLMSSTKEIAPLVTLDSQPVGSGRPGVVWSQLFDAYQERKQAS